MDRWRVTAIKLMTAIRNAVCIPARIVAYFRWLRAACTELAARLDDITASQEVAAKRLDDIAADVHFVPLEERVERSWVFDRSRSKHHPVNVFTEIEFLVHFLTSLYLRESLESITVLTTNEYAFPREIELVCSKTVTVVRVTAMGTLFGLHKYERTEAGYVKTSFHTESGSLARLLEETVSSDAFVVPCQKLSSFLASSPFLLRRLARSAAQLALVLPISSPSIDEAADHDEANLLFVDYPDEYVGPLFDDGYVRNVLHNNGYFEVGLSLNEHEFTRTFKISRYFEKGCGYFILGAAESTRPLNRRMDVGFYVASRFPRTLSCLEG